MSKLFNFLIKYTMWLKISFLVGITICLFLPTYKVVPYAELSEFISPYVCNPFSTFSDIPYLFVSTAVAPAWDALLTVIFYIGLIVATALSIKYKNPLLNLISILLAVLFDVSCLIFEPIRQSRLNAVPSYSFVLHIGGYLMLLITFCYIMYNIFYYLPTVKQAMINNKKPTKQQQIDDLKKQVEDLQNKIDNQ